MLACAERRGEIPPYLEEDHSCKVRVGITDTIGRNVISLDRFSGYSDSQRTRYSHKKPLLTIMGKPLDSSP